MPDNSIIFLGIIVLLFICILIFVHHAAKKRESVLREQLGNLGLLLDEEKSYSKNKLQDFEGQMKELVSLLDKEKSISQNQLNLRDSECAKLRKQIGDLETEINTRVATLMYEWQASEIDKIRKELKDNATHEARNNLDQWVAENKKSISEEARRISRAVIAGQVAERFVPFMPSLFKYNPKNARFIGSPIDLIVFDGADEDDVRGIIFIEVKTGKAVLSARQKQIKKLILNLNSPMVRWEETQIPLPEKIPDGVDHKIPKISPE
jgi:predicted Holliday junction resolvase-like endonuclease